MVPEHDAVIRDLAAQLTLSHGRLAVGGVRLPPGWPAWAVALGRTSTAVFGVTRAYEDIQPWRSVRKHMDEISFETAAGALPDRRQANASPERPHRTCVGATVSDFLIVFAFASLPVAGNFAAGLAAEIVNVSDRATPPPAGGRSREEPAYSPTVRPRPGGPTS